MRKKRESERRDEKEETAPNRGKGNGGRDSPRYLSIDRLLKQSNFSKGVVLRIVSRPIRTRKVARVLAPPPRPLRKTARTSRFSDEISLLIR
jgi:hypothetical protein